MKTLQRDALCALLLASAPVLAQVPQVTAADYARAEVETWVRERFSMRD